MRKKILLLTCASMLLIGGSVVNGWAEATPEEIARLGNDLTPFGAEKAGNGDGTIPAWQGGITTPPAGYEVGMHHIDPYSDDKIIATITAENMDQYADKLTAGHKALLKAYPTFKMNIYPTHRSASAPQRIYDATRRIAQNAKMISGGNGLENVGEGTPFPIPDNGLEIVWNHLTRWRGNSLDRHYHNVPVTRSGKYVLGEHTELFDIRYSHPGMDDSKLNNIIYYYKSEDQAPARISGTISLVHETLDQNKEPRKAWSYNPGQRRVRRAPQIAFDTPTGGGDGLETMDSLDLFNGSPERYDWKLVGKKEMYVPYNAYRIMSPDISYKELLTPLHPLTDTLRYELHRVWVVEGTLKEGTSHIYKRRTFYVDEDSWSLVGADLYDTRDNLWRISEGHTINFYEVPAVWNIAEIHYDLQAGRYMADKLTNEIETMWKFNVEFARDEFSPQALRRGGKR
ncbi:DUF1329 domain-containing protein [Desulforhopalus singaporensis]|uniref:Outer membrane lipoprotein-sorting protein n=1 Tax=Desulforhopalus singaporensis TaxID=91360 RepID=A0A1H0SDF6_9BACT|nr:DUF1329 domain-containing protein [Desulforhopalus singaporensis]SDP39549.1 Protein of unknown function [Desulforhopalus singaporensis]